MAKFLVEMNYKASILCDVDADNEGEALSKAREMAEEADIRQFSICGEDNANIINRY